MTPRKQSLPLERLLRAQRGVSLRMLTSSIAHSLGSGLQVVGGRAALVNDDPNEHATTISRKVREMTEEMQGVLRFGRASLAPAAPTPVAPELAALVELLGPVARANGLEIEIDQGVPLEVLARADDLLVALVSVSVMALETIAAGSLRWSVRRHEGGPPPSEAGIAARGPFVRLEASWPGAELRLAELTQPREPWLAPPATVPIGHALALAMALQVARESAGWIDWEQVETTSVRVHLPVVSPHP
jgi:hypothetical protein